ncbi:MAG: hypothetical protein ACREB0_11055, partial [Sphingopyxis sp.]
MPQHLSAYRVEPVLHGPNIGHRAPARKKRRLARLGFERIGQVDAMIGQRCGGRAPHLDNSRA